MFIFHPLSFWFSNCGCLCEKCSESIVERGNLCSFPDSDVVTITKGKIPPFDALNDPSSTGFTNIRNMGTSLSPDYQIEVQVTSTDRQTFKTYQELKNHCQFLLTYSDELSLDVFLFRLQWAMRLVEQNGNNLEEAIFYRPRRRGDNAYLVLHALDGTMLFPNRLDVCECRNLLKCPNGTYTNSVGAQSIDDCVVRMNDVLRRIPITLPGLLQSNATEDMFPTSQLEYMSESEKIASGNVHLKAYDTAHFMVNLSSLPRNMTYGKDYQMSIYRNCKPCPTRYRCKSETGCSYPSKEDQYSRLNLCLQNNRKIVCVHQNGTSLDIQSCRDGNFGNKSLIYTEPNLEKCLSSSLFCNDKSWNHLIFRKLCRDDNSVDKSNLVYRCSLVDRWFHYKTWKDDICCAVKNELDRNYNCTGEPCVLDESEDRILTERFHPIFEKEFGFPPPEFEPKASLVMSKELQEDSENSNPLSLFEEWTYDSVESPGIRRPFNTNKPEQGPPWKHTSGCCTCKPQPLPAFFQRNIKTSGFSDNKHHNISFTVTALRDTEITVVVELLSGQFYGFFDNYFDQKDVFTTYLHRPTRFARGDKGSQWLSVIRRDTFSNSHLDLPLNLPMTQTGQEGYTSMENSILIDRPCKSLLKTHVSENSADMSYNDDGRITERDECIQDKYSTVYQSEAWWNSDLTPSTQDVDSMFSAIALPYFPFFSSCDGFDSHVSLSKLLEEHGNCTVFHHNETNQVRQLSLANNNSPKGDYCLANFPPIPGHDHLREGAALQCAFEEQVDSASDRYRWYESKSEDTLYYITQNAVPSDMFIAKYSMINGNSLVSRRWGRADITIDGQHMVPVKVRKHHGGVKNAIPRDISLDLQYFQVDRSTKRLVRATLSYSNLCTTLKPEHFGGDPEMLREMKEMDILPCDTDVNGKIKSQGYDLRIALYPLDWFNLLNSFQFHGFVYFIYFTIAGCTSMVIGYIIYIISKVSTKLRHPPKFHGSQLFKLLAGPSIIGSSLAVMAFVGCSIIVFATINPRSAFIGQISGDWYTTSIPDDEVMKNTRDGRTGAIIFVLSVYSTIVSASFVIQHRDGAKVKNDEEEDFIVDSETNKAPKSDSWSPITWKRAHFVLCCFGLELCLLCLWELSYSSVYKANLHQITIISKVLFVILEIAITKVLKEKLLCVPFLVAIGITEVITTMGAADFVDFTVLFFLQIIATIFHRLYIDPCVKCFESIWPRWRFILIKKLMPRIRMTVQQKRNEENKWRKINEIIELRNEGVEPLIDAITLSTVNITTRILAPLSFIMLSFFYSESQMAENYSVSDIEISYYVLFAFCMIPWIISVDVMTFNAQELVHGWRLYDYLVYQRHRFGSRDYRWSLNIPYYDESILEPLQSIDLMSFSSQYYFVAALLSGSITTTLFGGTILLRTKQYNFLSDPALPIIIAGVTILIRLLKHSTVYLSSIKIKYLDWEGIWAAIQIEGTLDDMIASKLQIGEGRKVDLEKERMELEALNNERFRQRFLERNRPWILRHLVELLADNNGGISQAEKIKIIDYSKGVYSDLVAMGHGHRRVGDRSDISSDDDEDAFDDVQRRWDSCAVLGTSRNIARLWLDKARKRRMYALSIRELMQSYQQQKCLNCAREKASCKRISVCLCTNGRYNPTALDALISHFEEEFPSSVNDTMLWNSFVRKYAEIKALCNICMALPDQASNNITELRRVTRPGDISSDDENDVDSVPFQPLVIDKLSLNGQLLTKWMLAARTKMGGRFPRPEAELYCRRYIEKLKRSHTENLTIKNESYQNIKNPSKKEKWERMRVDQTSREIVSRWLSIARENNGDRDDAQGIALRDELNHCLAQMEPVDDWHFEALRLEGLQLQADGAVLTADTETIKTQEARAAKDIDTEKDSKIQEIESKITRKRLQFDEKLKELQEERASLSMRTRELKFTADRLPLTAEGERQKLEATIAMEERNSEEEWKDIVKRHEQDLNLQTKAFERDIARRTNEAKQEISFNRKQYKSKVDEKEQNWRERTYFWMDVGKRKLSARGT